MAQSWFHEKGWRRIYNANLVKEINGRRCSIIWIKGGGYRWCVIFAKEAVWSGEKFNTEEEAVADVMRELKNL